MKPYLLLAAILTLFISTPINAILPPEWQAELTAHLATIRNKETAAQRIHELFTFFVTTSKAISIPAPLRLEIAEQVRTTAREQIIEEWNDIRLHLEEIELDAPGTTELTVQYHALTPLPPLMLSFQLTTEKQLEKAVSILQELWNNLPTSLRYKPAPISPLINQEVLHRTKVRKKNTSAIIASVVLCLCTAAIFTGVHAWRQKQGEHVDGSLMATQTTGEWRESKDFLNLLSTRATQDGTYVYIPAPYWNPVYEKIKILIGFTSCKEINHEIRLGGCPLQFIAMLPLRHQ